MLAHCLLGGLFVCYFGLYLVFCCKVVLLVWIFILCGWGGWFWFCLPLVGFDLLGLLFVLIVFV